MFLCIADVTHILLLNLYVYSGVTPCKIQMQVTSPQVGQVEIEPDTLWMKVKDVIRGAIQGRWK